MLFFLFNTINKPNIIKLLIVSLPIFLILNSIPHTFLSFKPRNILTPRLINMLIAKHYFWIRNRIKLTHIF